jgi:hypothetical protein
VLSLFSGVTHCRNERLLHTKNGSAAPIRAEPNSTAEQWAIFAVLPEFVEEISANEMAKVWVSIG